jgi:RIO kinase 1
LKVPEPLWPLVDEGIIDEVVRPLMAGKEAEVFLVTKGDEYRVAKVYKQATHRSFRQRAEYTEGRKVRNSRQQRAIDKRGSKFGRDQSEAAWRDAEVNAIYTLEAAGVRVPQPFDFVEGVLVMELIGDKSTGHPAPRLVDIELDREGAERVFRCLIRETVKMLCAGIVHGDLSDFNVLLGPDGPVIIDFPQWVDPAVNRNAKKLLVRDVKNITLFLSRWIPGLKKTRYGPEMWDLYEKGELRPDTKLTGKYRPKLVQADTMSLLEEIEAIERENREKREALGLPPRRSARKPVTVEPEKPKKEGKRKKKRGPAKEESGGSQGQKARGGRGGQRRDNERDGNRPNSRGDGRRSRGKSDGRKTEGRKPDARKPDARKPDARKPDARKPDARKTESGQKPASTPATPKRRRRRRPRNKPPGQST